MFGFHKDNSTGGKTRWSAASRLIGHEGERNVWVLSENMTPVLVSAHSFRPANDSEPLARAILNGEEIVPSEIIGEDQRFVDARLPDPEAPEDSVPAIPED